MGRERDDIDVAVAGMRPAAAPPASDARVPGLERVLELGLGDAPLDETLEVLVDLIEAQSRHAVTCSVLLMDRGTGTLRDLAGDRLPRAYRDAIDGLAVAPGMGSCGTAAATGEPVIVTDIATDPLWRDFRDLALPLGLRACWSTPILGRDGGVLGTFAMYYPEPAEPDPADFALVDLVAKTTALLIERDQARRTRRQASDDTRFLLDLTERIRRASDEDVLMAEATRAIGDYLGAERCYIAEVDERADRFAILHDHHPGHAAAPPGEQRLSAIPPDILDVLRGGRVVSVPLGARSHAIVPLLRGGRWISALVVTQGTPREWQARELLLLETLAERAWHALERLRMSRRFARQRRLYEGILDNTPDLAYVFDRQHRFIYANRTLLQMWGKTWDEARGRTCLELGYEPWHAQMHDREIEEVVATRQPVRGVVPFAGTFGRRIYDYIFVPVLGGDGEVEAIAGTTRDITELKDSEEALRESDRRKDQFLATLAHELRNPLAPLRNCLQILRMDRAGTVDRAQLEGVMERQVDQLVHLVDGLLDVSRLTRGRVELHPERTSLGRVIDHAVETARPQVDAAGHQLEVDVEDPLLVLEADPVRLCQVVANLIDNAARFTEPGGRIGVFARRQDDEAVVVVRDNGPGIAAEDLPRVFDLFVQSQSPRAPAQGGLGVGLTLVRTLVELHGGTVVARSDGAGQGSEFEVRLPLPEVPVA